MTRITKDRGALRHDDRLDCLAMGVRYWVDRMNVEQRRGPESTQRGRGGSDA